MPDATETFQIKIVSTADNSGFAAAAQGAGELTKAQAGVVEVTEQDIKKATEDKEETGKLEISKRELRETLRQLGPEFGLVGEAASLAFNPITLAVGGALLALRTLGEAAQVVEEDLSEVEMPDLSVEFINKATTAWNGLATAVANANEATNDPEGIYQRSIRLLNSQIELEQTLNKLRGVDSTGAKISESKKELGLKGDEAGNLAISAQDKAAQAANLPSAEATKKAKELDQKRIEWATAEIEKIKKEKAFIEEVMNGGPLHPINIAKYNALYGDTPGWKALQEANTHQAQIEQTKAGSEASIARADEIDKQRDALRNSASEDQRKSTEIYDNLPTDALVARNTQFQDELARGTGVMHQTLGELLVQTGQSNTFVANVLSELVKNQIDFKLLVAQLQLQLAEQARSH